MFLPTSPPPPLLFPPTERHLEQLFVMHGRVTYTWPLPNAGGGAFEVSHKFYLFVLYMRASSHQPSLTAPCCTDHRVSVFGCSLQLAFRRRNRRQRVGHAKHLDHAATSTGAAAAAAAAASVTFPRVATFHHAALSLRSDARHTAPSFHLHDVVKVMFIVNIRKMRRFSSRVKQQQQQQHLLIHWYHRVVCNATHVAAPPHTHEAAFLPPSSSEGVFDDPVRTFFGSTVADNCD